jgi:hypothetical protein
MEVRLKPTTPKKPRVVTIPSALQRFPVVFDPRTLPLGTEPKDKHDTPIYGRTDNSNTQFALLAVWAARRHGVPATRTLNLITRRFLTSQNGDGSWGYLYKLGGGEAERPAMTCVGLLGLAVGYGLAHEAGEAPRGVVQDPRIVGGFAALSKNVGQPSGRMEKLPMKNLYFLWSVERVGVLYNVGTIGGKDWYRWGAEILVANQKQAGNWEGGGYHGADATIDTCLALLFLKRANLATDLATRLPFNPEDLQKRVDDRVQPVTTKTAIPDPPEAPEQEKSASTPAPAEPPAHAGTDPIVPPQDPPQPTSAPTRTPIRPPVAQSPGAEVVEQGGSSGWVLLLLLLGVLLAGLGWVVLSHRSRGKEDPPTRPRGKGRGPRKALAG